jgi:hypothetical protein
LQVHPATRDLHTPIALSVWPGAGAAAESCGVITGIGQLSHNDVSQQAFARSTSHPIMQGQGLGRWLHGTVTVEVARQQDDGTWLWVIDQPAFIPPNR